MFKESFAAAIGLQKPLVPLQEEFEDPMIFQQAQEEHAALKGQFTAELDQVRAYT